MNTVTLLLAFALAAQAAPAQQRPPAAADKAEVSVPSLAAESGGPLLSLEQALKEAQEKNLDLKQAQAKLTQASLGWRKVLAQYLPQVSAAGSYTHNDVEQKFTLPSGYWMRDMSMYGSAWDRNDPTKGNGPDWNPAKGSPSIPDNPPGTASNILMVPSGFETLTIQKENQFGGQISLQQALIVPALWPAFGLADLGEQLATQSVEMARREILFGVAQLYYGSVGLKQVIDVQQRLLQNQLDHEKDAKVRVDAGAMPKIVLIRAQIDRARAEQDLLRAKVSYASAKVALSTLLDRESNFEVAQPEEPTLPADLSGLEGAALRDRPDIAVAQTGRELADKSHGAVYYQYLPNLLAKGTVQAANIKGFSNSYAAWAVSVMISWTLWDGGLREVSLKENASKVIEADAALRSAQNKARDDVKRALMDLEMARANLSKAEEQRKLARENEQLVNVNYQAGVATQIEVSDANTALAAAELGYIGETLNSQMSALKVLKAAGAFNPKF